MPFFAGALRKLLLISAALILFVSAMPVHSQDVGPETPLEIATVLNPSLDQPVAPLDTLILIKIDDYYIGPDYFYLILLDDKPIIARWDPDALTFSYYPDRMLDIGEHTIKVFMTITGEVEHQLVAHVTFTVGTGGATAVPSGDGTLFDLSAPTEPPPSSPVTSSSSQDSFTLNGRATIDARSVDFDGLGGRLRQEPESTSIFDLNGRGNSGDTDFDFRFYLTTDESRYMQPRNRYRFNIDREDYGFSVGDTNPRFDPLIIDGLRVRGASGWGSFGPFTVRVVEGEARRSTETKIDENGLMQRRGVGEQRLWAARLGLWEDEDFSLGINYLSGEEEASDTGISGFPGENTVIATDFFWQFNDDAYLQGTWATADYDFEDPDLVDIDGAEAMELIASYAIGGHTLKLKYQLIDPGFRSLGRLSLQRDRETWGFEDTVTLFNRSLTGRLFIERFHNNIDGSLPITTTSTRFGGQLRYRFSLGGPTLTFGLTRQNRTNDVDWGETGNINDSITMINLGVLQSFDLLGASNTLRVDWRTTDRSNAVTPENSSTQDSLTVRLTSRWTRGFQLDMMYGNTDSEYPGRARWTDVGRYSVRLGYTIPSRTVNLWTSWEGVRSDGTQATYDSARDTIEFGMRWMLSDELSLEASGKFVDFDDQMDNANDFEEHSFRIMVIQLLN